MTAEVMERRQRRQATPELLEDRAPAFTVARVDLLPPIVEVRRRQSRTARLLALGLVGLLVVVAAVGLAMSFLAGAAENALAGEQTRSQLLLLEQAKYSEVSTVKSQLADYSTAELAALYSEADWARLMGELDDALPDDFSLTTETITIKGIDTGRSGSGEDTGLDAPGVIEISFTATADAFDSPTPLLNALSGLTGYVSATVDAVSASGEKGYVVTGVIQLGADALGGTARVAALDEETITTLHGLLEAVATGAIDADALADAAGDSAGTAATDAADGTETGE